MKKFWENYFDINSVISEQETIVGILIPIKWSHNGTVEMFAIYSEEHDVIIEEYRSTCLNHFKNPSMWEQKYRKNIP